MASSGEGLNADACALLLGMATPKGAVNRRGFLERVAPRGRFPKPLVIGNEKKGKRSAVAQWADDARRSTRARSDARRVGKGWVSTFRPRWSPDHLQLNHIGALLGYDLSIIPQE